MGMGRGFRPFGQAPVRRKGIHRLPKESRRKRTRNLTSDGLWADRIISTTLETEESPLGQVLVVVVRLPVVDRRHALHRERGLLCSRLSHPLLLERT